MSTGTTTFQGSFLSTGGNIVIPFATPIDWMRVINLTIADDQSPTTQEGVEYYWQRGFPFESRYLYYKSNATNADNLIQYRIDGGFTFVDTTSNPIGDLNNGSTGISNISNANPPVVTVGSTTDMLPGNVVRIYNVVGAQQLGGIDFTIGYGTFSGTSFSLDYMSAIATAASPGAGASFRVIQFDPIFYPRRRYITKITRASQAVVTLSVTHQYQVGQAVRFVIPAVYGMPQMDGLLGTIVAIDTSTTAVTGNTITVDIDSSTFSSFAFPVTSIHPFSPAEVVPVGEDTGVALSLGSNILNDSTINEGMFAMILNGGDDQPGGRSVGDTMIWQAGTVFSTNNLISF